MREREKERERNREKEIKIREIVGRGKNCIYYSFCVPNWLKLNKQIAILMQLCTIYTFCFASNTMVLNFIIIRFIPQGTVENNLGPDRLAGPKALDPN